ncbi:CoA transferase [Streptomyces sp. SS1-1]|uniref:CaiB/BaiF CoA transferase family protein n=1 Tax=Streptomyces sp. SS1-1 TaxID=2651869 RepID=UPI0012500A20|nr:CoA transferase [Streptomyces sp. SS1-1]KAB2977552.1 CoA transferase [Streptomyces sp. SS1-1]
MTHINSPGPLEGLRVVDLSTSLGTYTGRLLADLGADVIRVEPKGGAPERSRPPLTDDGTSLPFAFTEAGKRSIVLDGNEIGACSEQLESLLETAQILLTSEGPSSLRRRGLHPLDVTHRHPQLIHVCISPFGLSGPWADRPATDLTLLAAGGLLALAGDPALPPVRAWGNQTSVIAGVHAATAALMAVLVLEETSQGQIVDVSVQEAVAHSLENAVQYVDLEKTVRHRVGSGPVEAGTGLFPCSDGWIYLVGGLGGLPLAWESITTWLVDSGLHEAAQLHDPRWHDRSWRRSGEAVRTFRGLFERFAAGRTKQALYEDGQRRGISIAPVSTPDDLLTSPQLLERNFFLALPVNGRTLPFPGSPYRFDGMTVAPGAPPAQPGADTQAVLETLPAARTAAENKE